MKRINVLYILVLVISFFWIKFMLEMNADATSFYGFAENKETEISHDADAKILEILVSPGEKVKKGDVLLIVEQDKLPFRQNQAELSIDQVRTEWQLKRKTLKQKIQQSIEAEKIKLKTIDQEIASVKQSINDHNAFISNLKSVDLTQSNTKVTELESRLSLLESNRSAELEKFELDRMVLNNELENLKGLERIEIKQRIAENETIKATIKKLKITAPSDGIIGNISCKLGEYIPAFRSYLNFYEERPNIVKGFIHESQLSGVEANDTLLITSALHTDLQVYGTVNALGNRIVEIPERMRKNPDIKSYGREILISIPLNNPFLQKEKVTLTLINEDGVIRSSNSGFLSSNK